MTGADATGDGEPIDASIGPRVAPESLPSTKPLPVFIHSSFRTSSTWLWARLRRCRGVLAYYEVFHEALATFTPAGIGALKSQGWQSHHPPSAPYFLEFLPLLQPEGGVRGFHADMAFDRFVPPDGLRGTLPAAERCYIQGLIEEAEAGGKVPVLTCTRSLGRVAAIGKALPVRSVLLHRNLFHQWASYSGQALGGNRFFLDTIDRTLKASRHDPVVRALDDVFATRVADPTDEQTFAVFLLLHLHLLAQAHDAADLVIDATALASDRGIREATERALSDLVRSPVDLSDARSNIDASVVLVRDRAGFVDTIEQFTKLVTASSATPGSAAFAENLCQEALSEWDRHDRLARRVVSWALDRTAALERSLDEHRHGLVALTAERDGLAARLAETAAAREAAEAAAVALSAERDALRARLAATSAAEGVAAPGDRTTSGEEAA